MALRNLIQKLLEALFPFLRRKPRVERKEWKWEPRPEQHGPHFSPTKAYADQRQKARWNRKRKPNKHIRNLYHL